MHLEEEIKTLFSRKQRIHSQNLIDFLATFAIQIQYKKLLFFYTKSHDS